MPRGFLKSGNPRSLMVPRRSDAEAGALAVANDGLVGMVVHKLCPRGCAWLHRIGDHDDAMQIGRLALYIACQRWDETSGVKLTTYAVLYIQGTIQRALQDGGLIHTPKIKTLDPVFQEHKDRAAVIEHLETVNSEHSIASTLADLRTPDPYAVVAEADERRVRNRLIGRALRRIDARKRRAFLDYVRRGLTYEQIGRATKPRPVSKEMVRQWIAEVKNLVWKKLRMAWPLHGVTLRRGA